MQFLLVEGLFKNLVVRGSFRGRRFLQAIGHSTPRWPDRLFNGSSVRRTLINVFPFSDILPLSLVSTLISAGLLYIHLRPKAVLALG